MMVFLRKIVLEECEMANFSRLRRAKTVKRLKTMSKSVAGEKNLGPFFSDKKAPPYSGAIWNRGGFLKWNTPDVSSDHQQVILE